MLELSARGFDVLHADAPDVNESGIVTFSKPGQDMASLTKQLGQAGVTVSLRTLRNGSKLIRRSPHFYNTNDELDRLLEVL